MNEYETYNRRYQYKEAFQAYYNDIRILNDFLLLSNPKGIL